MRVHLVKKRNIDHFISKHRLSKSCFYNWISQLKQADWNNPNDIIDTFNTADQLGAGSKRIVFNIGGNNYRMICEYFFGEDQVHLFIRWIGTHDEYTKLCQTGNQSTIRNY